MQENNPTTGRRDFLQTAMRAGAVVGLGAVAGYAAHLLRSRARRSRGETRVLGEEFCYDVGKFQETDPQLVAYQEVTHFKTGLREARAVHVGPEDRLFVAGDQVVRVFRADGTQDSEIRLDAAPKCVFATPDGGVFVGFRSQVGVYSATGDLKTKWETLGDGAVLTCIAVGKNDVFLADAGNRVILRLDRAGKEICRIGQKDEARHVPGLVVPSPFLCVRIAADGLLRVTNPGRHRIEAYTFDGDLEFSWGKPSMAIDGFCGCCNPVNFEMLPDGRYVTCEKGLPRVKIYDSDGKFESVVVGPERFGRDLKACAEGLSGCQDRGLGVAVDSQGRVFVLDVYSGEVVVMKRKT